MNLKYEIEPAPARPTVRLMGAFTFSIVNVYETLGSIEIKIYLKHHLGWGNVTLCFGPDRLINYGASISILQPKPKWESTEISNRQITKRSKKYAKIRD